MTKNRTIIVKGTEIVLYPGLFHANFLKLKLCVTRPRRRSKNYAVQVKKLNLG